MTDTTTIAAHPSWLSHPILAWRAYQAALAERADAEARASGLTVQVLPNGARRYRDPRLDQLATYRARHTAPGQVDRRAAAATVSSQWSPVRRAGAPVDRWGHMTCGSSRAHAPDLPAAGAEPAEPATSTTDRLRRAGPLAGAGAVPPPTVPPQGHSGFASVSHATALRAALDPGHPAAAVSGAPAGSREEHAPARLPSGPAHPPGGAR